VKRFRLSTLVLVIVIIALGLALVIQYDRAQRREAFLSAQLKHTLMQWRDSLGKELRAAESEYLALMQGRPQDSARRDELQARIVKTRAEFNAVVDRLKAQP
jgi:hypothetical protein